MDRFDLVDFPLSSARRKHAVGSEVLCWQPRPMPEDWQPDVLEQRGTRFVAASGPVSVGFPMHEHTSKGMLLWIKKHLRSGLWTLLEYRRLESLAEMDGA